MRFLASWIAALTLFIGLASAPPRLGKLFYRVFCVLNLKEHSKSSYSI